MLCIGLTGNIASGKSTVAALFAELGIEVISADAIAKEITAKNQPAFHTIITHFGHEVKTENGELNRRYLRQLIFDNEHERQWLEKLLHPLIRKEIALKIQHVKTPYCIVEIPLLYDKSTYPDLNRVLLIKAESEQQITRVMRRDNCSREEALAILASQPDEKKRRDLADDILVNKGSLPELKEKVLSLHKKYLQLALP